jgi:GntR family transcriptional repressor for pyruvate dehydrogenase complex
MRRVLEAQEAQVKGGGSGTDEDVAFHELIAEATGNPALVQLMKNIADLLQETRDASLQLDGRPARSVRENQAVLAAIEARSPALAASRMRAHIRSLELVLFAGALEPPETLQTCHTEGKSHS